MDEKTFVVCTCIGVVAVPNEVGGGGKTGDP